MKQVKNIIRHEYFIITFLATLAMLIKLYISAHTYGTNDVYSWQIFADIIKKFGGINVYYIHNFFNHPPFIIHFLQLCSFLTAKTNIPFSFWLRLPGILTDFGAVFLIKKIVDVSNIKYSRIVFYMMILAPVSIMVSGFHGNTDPIFIFFLLLSIFFLCHEKAPYVWLAGIAFGISVSIKIIPLIFIPPIFFFLPNIRSRFRYFSSAFITSFIMSLPYIFIDPLFIIKRLLTYNSIYGHWGITRILISTHSYILNILYFHYGKFFILGGIILISFFINKRIKKPPIFIQYAFVAFFFMTFTPGFGVQYLAWLAPWVILLNIRKAIVYHIATGTFLFAVYTFWSGGIPWFYANSLKIGDWRGYIILLELLCWLAVVMACWTISLRLKNK